VQDYIVKEDNLNIFETVLYTIIDKVTRNSIHMEISIKNNSQN